MLFMPFLFKCVGSLNIIFSVAGCAGNQSIGQGNLGFQSPSFISEGLCGISLLFWKLVDTVSNCCSLSAKRREELRRVSRERA